MKFRSFPYDKDVKVTYLVTVTMGCGCAYDKFERDGYAEDTSLPRLGQYIRRYRQTCEDHSRMCRGLEPWEIED